MAQRHPSWRLADIIDYECFLNADERETAASLHERDRAFYRDEIEPALPPADPAARDKKDSPTRERRALLRRWLDCRRKLEIRRAGGENGAQEVLLPGDAFAQIFATTRWWLVFLGLLIGWGLASAALMYSANAEPINAFTFFVEFAAAQAAILTLAFAVLAARHWFPTWQIPSLMRFCLRLSAGLARNLWRKHRVRIAGATRQNTEAVFGILRSRHTLYGSIFVWSLVLLTQAFAISFNLGVLGAMTSRHLFHDLDFGWESTWLDAGQVARGTELSAAPWSWTIPAPYPNAEQVRGSQNHKRGAGKLDAESLKSWSHFLFGAVICYGLLPRVALALFAGRAQRAALGRLRFGDGRSALLLSRLQAPIMQTHGSPLDPAAPALLSVLEPEPPPVIVVPPSPPAPIINPAPEPPPAPVPAVNRAPELSPTPQPKREPSPAPVPVPQTRAPEPPPTPVPVFTPPTPPPAPLVPAKIPAAPAATVKTQPAPAPPPVRASAATAGNALLALNLTGRPLSEAQASQFAANGRAPGAVSIFEAGSLSLEQDEQAFGTLKRQAAALPDAEIFAFIASWTAPMIASKLLLDQLRASIGRDRLVNVALVGRPAPDGSAKPVRPNDRELWAKAVQARGDAFIALR